jgi:CubicO group peptidase (beta-lactamase class C family)
MKSGMLTPPDQGPLSGDLWSYLNTYLAQPLIGTPGVTYSYNNENFTILQGVIDQVTGQDYVTWVTQNVLVPAGLAPSIFNPNPDPDTTATLLYSGPSDIRDGYYYGPLDFVAPGGFISTALELLKIPLALRNTSVLPAAAISEMLNDGIGWFPYAGNFGTYYQKDGGLHNGGTPQQTLNTASSASPKATISRWWPTPSRPSTS